MPQGSYGTGFGFTGEYTDANDLLYLRARYYAPGMGVFTALDPWEGKNCTPMSLNGYSWVEGRVVNATDPTGMSPWADCRTKCSYSGPYINGQLLDETLWRQCIDDCEASKPSLPSDPRTICNNLNGGACGGGYYQRDDSGTIQPYQPPPIDANSAQELIDAVNDYNEICGEWCNEGSDNYIVNKLTGYDCRRNAQDICKQLCLWSPRSDQNTIDHIGLIIRWLHYYVDKNNSRPTHVQPYLESRDELNQILENNGFRTLTEDDTIDGWTRSACAEQNGAARVFDAEARRWAGKALPATVHIPECNTNALQYAAVFVLGIATIGLIFFIPTVGEEAIPIAGMGMVAPCLINN